MQLGRGLPIAIGAFLLVSCGPSRDSEKLTVAAAANLTEVFGEVGRAFTAKTGVDVVFSYGSTAELAQQIANGGPFDVFAAADTEHVDSLIASGKLTRASRAIYALGELALWVPRGERSSVKELKDLVGKQVRFVSVAQPDLAPYGKATIEALKGAGVWDAVQLKIVYANSISQAKQLASSGNADAAFTAYSLVFHEHGSILKVDRQLYRPIEQAMGILTSSARPEAAKQFSAFLLDGEGRAILAKSGYLVP